MLQSRVLRWTLIPLLLVLLVATGAAALAMRLFTPHETRPLQTWTPGTLVEAVAFSPDGQLLAAGGADGTIRLWRVGDRSLVRALAGDSSTIHSLAFSPDGESLIAGAGKEMVGLWRVDDGAVIQMLTGNGAPATELAVSPDGQLIATGSRESVHLWGLAGGEMNRILPVHPPPAPGKVSVLGLAFGPDGQSLLVGNNDDTVQRWSLPAGVLAQEREGYAHLQTMTTPYVTRVAFNPDGTLVASTQGGVAIDVWRLSDGRHQYTLRGHRDGVSSLTFSPDGRFLASGGGPPLLTSEGMHLFEGPDRTIRLWRLADGAEVAKFTGHTGTVLSIAFSPDGALLASGDNEGTVRLWAIK